MRILFSLLVIFCLSGWTSAQNGLDFDGVNDYVGSNYSGISGNAERTMEAWIKTTVNAIGNQQVIADMGTMTPGTRFTFCLLQNNSIRLEVGGNGIVGTTAVNDGMWHHVAVTFDPSAPNNLKLYIDGNLETQGNFTVGVNTSGSGSVEVGRRNDGVNQFTGSIDEFRVWDVALSEAEIQAAMNDEICNLSPNLRLYYRFNEGTAGAMNLGVNQASDDSGNGFTGTLNNFAYNGATSNWVVGATLGAGLSSSTTSLDACETYTWPLNGQTYTNSGNYSEVLTGSSGCDSTVILDLSIFSPNNLTTNQVACDTFTWVVNGQTYTSTTSVTETLTTSQGCPYDHTLNVTINEGFDTTDMVSACAPYVWPVNGMSYSIPGQYSEVFTNANGCDSVWTLDLFLWSTLSADITQNQDGTLSTTFAGTRNWYDCNNDSIITGETGMIFTPTVNGSYAVIISDWGFACPDTSDCITVDYVSLDPIGPLTIPNFIEPNPTNGAITVSVLEDWESATIEIVTVDGKVIQTKQITNGSSTEMIIEGSAGIYYVRATSNHGFVFSRPVVKM